MPFFSESEKSDEFFRDYSVLSKEIHISFSIGFSKMFERIVYILMLPLIVVNLGEKQMRTIIYYCNFAACHFIF